MKVSTNTLLMLGGGALVLYFLANGTLGGGGTSGVGQLPNGGYGPRPFGAVGAPQRRFRV